MNDEYALFDAFVPFNDFVSFVIKKGSTMKLNRTILISVFTAFSAADLHAQTYAQRMADAVIARNPIVHKEWDYVAGVALLAIQRVGEATKQPKYAAYVKTNMDAVVNPDGTIRS